MKANAFAHTFYFFATHQATTEKNKKSVQANAPDSAYTGSSLVDSVCRHLTVVLREKSRAAANIKPAQQKPLCKKSRQKGDFVGIFV